MKENNWEERKNFEQDIKDVCDIARQEERKKVLEEIREKIKTYPMLNIKSLKDINPEWNDTDLIKLSDVLKEIEK